MQHKQLLLHVILLLIIGVTGLNAQEAISAAGGDATGSGGSVSYSVGQLINITNTGTNGSVTQGVQQPYEISVISAMEEATGISLNCIAFPNPVSNYIRLKVAASASFDNAQDKSLNIHSLNYQLYDMHGKLLDTQKITAIETTITMQNLAPSTYFLKVTDGDKEVKIFKIIKN
jgi:hypothetical protein